MRNRDREKMIQTLAMLPVESGLTSKYECTVMECKSLMAAADIGSLWLCRNPPGHSAGNQRWGGPQACSSSTLA